MDKKQSAILFAITATQFVVPFMLSGVGVALPTIGREFNAAATYVSLMETSYICVVAMSLLPVGRLSDMIGRGRVFLLGLILLTLSTFLLAIPDDLVPFLLLRAFQGVGGSMTLATSLAIISDTFPSEERGRALGIVMGGVFLGISLGPTCGGLITSHLGWRWIFLLGGTLCLLSLLGSLKQLPRGKITGYEPMDWPGIALSAVFFAGLALGGANFHMAWGKVALALVPVSGVLFLLVQRLSGHPLIDARPLKGNKPFNYSCAVQFLCFSAAFGVVFLYSLHLQYVRGYTPMQAGLILAIQPILQALLSPSAGRMADRVSPRRLAAVGMAVTLCGLVLSLFVTTASPMMHIYASLALMGMGTAMFSTANLNVIMNSVTSRHYGMASALTGAVRTGGMTASMALIGLLLALHMGSQPVTAATRDLYQQAMHNSLIILVALCALGTWYAFRVPEHGVRHIEG